MPQRPFFQGWASIAPHSHQAKEKEGKKKLTLSNFELENQGNKGAFSSTQYPRF